MIKEDERKVAADSDAKALEQLRQMQAIETRYEDKLAVEMKRLDALETSIAAMQEDSEALADSSTLEHEEGLRRHSRGFLKLERELRRQYEQLVEESKYQVARVEGGGWRVEPV